MCIHIGTYDELFRAFQVNMMSAQMLNSAGTMAGTIADLAPGAKDDMRMLEAKAVEMAGTTTAPKGGGIMFVRGETQGMLLTLHRSYQHYLCIVAGDDKDKVVNPDEINIDDDEDDEEEDGEGEVDIAIEKQNVPVQVFGSLKKTDNEEDDD